MERQTEIGMQQPARGSHDAISVLSSFIRTVTVGSGISPDLLTPTPVSNQGRALAGSPSQIGIPPVGNFTPP